MSTWRLPGETRPDRGGARAISTVQFFQTSVHCDDPAFGDLGIWDKRTGGDVTIAAVKHRPGGLGPERMYRSLPTYSACVVTRVMEEDRGDYELLRRLKQAAGRVYMTITEQPLDDSGHPYGSPQTWYGRLGNVKGGEYDSNGTGVRNLEIDVEIESST